MFINSFKNAFHFLHRFEDDESLSELDEEVILPKNARVIHANITGKFIISNM